MDDFTMTPGSTGNSGSGLQPDTAELPVAKPVDREWADRVLQVLEKYKAGKARLERRVIASENWWKLRNGLEEDRENGTIHDRRFRSQSAWLHNVIATKHADAMEAFPAPNILPRDPSDQETARELTSVIPCIMELNHFEDTYSEIQWDKAKFGTGVYKVVWDRDALNGMGDVSISRVDLLNLFWEPGISDIQDSRYVFHTALEDNDILTAEYPQLEGKLGGMPLTISKFSYDDSVDTSEKSVVIDVYYKQGGLLQYAKIVGSEVLQATENDPETAERGLYDHGMYPFVFDALFPIEGYPNCGYGYVDLCKGPQTEIDLMKTAMVRNTKVCATPRYFRRQDSGINMDEFLDLEQEIVDTDGNLGEDSLRQIVPQPMSGVHISMLEESIKELRETSGNTESATGATPSGVTAASAIAALQEASGKGSKDATRTSYRAYTKVVELVIEIDRQFYDLPRKFRIMGQNGQFDFVDHSNAGLIPQHQGVDFGVDMGYRKPTFDIKVSAQKANVYTRVSQNEMAIQFFQLGFFNPQAVDQTIMCLDLMDFDGKDELRQKVAQMGTMQQQLQMYQQLAITLCQQYRPDLAQQLAMRAAADGNPMAAAAQQQPVHLSQADAISGKGREATIAAKARERAVAASQPSGGRVVAERDRKNG